MRRSILARNLRPSSQITETASTNEPLCLADFKPLPTVALLTLQCCKLALDAPSSRTHPSNGPPLSGGLTIERKN